jgi:hypothetical protein
MFGNGRRKIDVLIDKSTWKVFPEKQCKCLSGKERIKGKVSDGQGFPNHQPKRDAHAIQTCRR